MSADPEDFAADIEAPEGERLRFRPIVPEDAAALAALLENADPDDIRKRFFTSSAGLAETVAEDLANLDTDREAAFVLATTDPPGEVQIVGGVRLVMDREHEVGEYALMVRSDSQGKGLGRLLMERILDYARARGVKTVIGEVARDNRAMLTVCRKLGFESETDPNDLALIIVSKTL